MKKIVTIYITVIFALNIAKITQGFILTLLYVLNYYTVENIKMSNFINLTISAFVVTVMLWSLRKIQIFVQNKSVNVS
ncbi:hypothetical protein ABFY48_13320 [Lysinibacillus pakistanensis]|uniref:Uncharacterized protein n=1 Tax=Lysinibacillus pakistanensis TaxID=759811 RepID=A0ABX6DBB1_9BACI|nr:hypothetical protein GDS87_14670 [Lysinibacillus pakistanensis]